MGLDALLAEADALVAATTNGPWRTDTDGCCVCGEDGHLAGPFEDGDAAFVARSRSLVPELVEAIRRIIRRIMATPGWADVEMDL